MSDRQQWRADLQACACRDARAAWQVHGHVFSPCGSVGEIDLRRLSVEVQKIADMVEAQASSVNSERRDQRTRRLLVTREEISKKPKSPSPFSLGDR
jgi:hypothetical protein